MSVSLPSKDSALGRSLRVLAYNLVVVLVAYASNPDTTKALVDYYPQLATIVALGAPFVSLAYNVFRKDVPNF